MNVFKPHWPEGLRSNVQYRVACDDKGRNGGAWLQVIISEDGDAWVSMMDWEEMPEGDPNPLPSFRCRTGCGGGRNARTRQALLWLAKAIELDSAEMDARQGKPNTRKEPQS